MIKGMINTSILISAPRLKQQNSILSCWPPPYCRHNRAVFTWNHHFSSCSAVVGITTGLSCDFGEGLGTGSWNGWHSATTVMGHHSSNDSTTKSTASHFSQLQSHPAFGEERSTLWRCYISKKWGLGLKKEAGAGEEVSRFSQFQNDDSWRTDLEIMRRRFLLSWWQHCSIPVYRTHWIPVALAIARTTEICQTLGRAEFGLCEDSSWTWQIFSSPLGNANSVNSISPQLMLLPQLSIHFVPKNNLS